MKLVIWRKGDNSLYYKLVRGYYAPYEVGFKNQYGHEVLFVLPNVYLDYYKPSLRYRFKKSVIRFLNKNL